MEIKKEIMLAKADEEIAKQSQSRNAIIQNFEVRYGLLLTLHVASK